MLKKLSKKIGLFNYHAALGQKKDRRWHPENFFLLQKMMPF
jgi:hypothetical protein